MNVVFRTDASLMIGTGHVMRCLTLADALSQNSAAVKFVTREHGGNLIRQIRERGYEVVPLPVNAGHYPYREPLCTEHDSWLGCHWHEDAEQSMVAIGSVPVDMLVVDHYALDVRWEEALRPACGSLMVIDDLANRAHECDILLDQTLGRSGVDYAELVPADCELLTGSMFALLRPEFRALRPASLTRRKGGAIRHIIVSMGGMDSQNFSGRVLDALSGCALPSDAHITVVMGSQSPSLQEVRERLTTMRWATEVRVDVADMAKLMSDSDLCIGAAGGTAWERCCLGLPTLLFIMAENQNLAAKSLVSEGAARLVTLESLLPEVDDLMSNPRRLVEMSQKASVLIDGLGADRVLKRLNGFCSQIPHA